MSQFRTSVHSKPSSLQSVSYGAVLHTAYYETQLVATREFREGGLLAASGLLDSRPLPAARDGQRDYLRAHADTPAVRHFSENLPCARGLLPYKLLAYG